MKPRAAVLISGSGSNLQALIDACRDSRLDLQLVHVISNRKNAYGLVRAQQAGIPCTIIEAGTNESRESYDKKLVQCLQNSNADLVVLAGFLRILSDGFVKHYLGRLINIHPSLLPRHKGLNTHRRALEAGDKQHGATVHYVVPELDAGPIIVQAALDIQVGENEQHLSQRVLALEHRIYPMALQWIVSGQIKFIDGKLVRLNTDLPSLINF